MGKPVIVMFHANCPDGFCAAWLVRGSFPDAEFLPCSYGDTPPSVVGKAVIMVDFCFKRDVMLEIARQSGDLTVIDHHVTSMQDMLGFEGECRLAGISAPHVSFDMSRSGAMLTWHFLWDMLVGHLPASAERPVPFYCTLTRDKPHWMVSYVEDRDLWRFSLPDSKAVNAALRSYPFDFDEWTRLSVKTTKPFVQEGQAILRYQSEVVKAHIRTAFEIEMAGHKVLCTNATTLVSEIAGELAKDRPFGVCYFDRRDGKRQYSLRSREGGVDVAAIAKSFGGGGHSHAAGFESGVADLAGRRDDAGSRS